MDCEHLPSNGFLSFPTHCEAGIISPHFTDEKTEAERANDSPDFTHKKAAFESRDSGFPQRPTRELLATDGRVSWLHGKSRQREQGSLHNSYLSVPGSCPWEQSWPLVTHA